MTPSTAGQWSKFHHRVVSVTVAGVVLGAVSVQAGRPGALTAASATIGPSSGSEDHESSAKTGRVFPDDGSSSASVGTASALSLDSPPPGSVLAGIAALGRSVDEPLGPGWGVRFEFRASEHDTWQEIASDTTAPYRVEWRTESVADGPVLVSAVVVDPSGNESLRRTAPASIRNQETLGHRPDAWYEDARLPGHDVTVEPWFGNLRLDVLDLPGVGGARPSELVRRYDSRRRSAGPLGPGWTLGVVSSVSEETDGALRYESKDGGRHIFPVSADGEYGSAATTNASASRSVGGGWMVEHPDGSLEQFSDQGLLVSDTDAAKRERALRYDSYGRLTEVTGPDGDHLSFTYDESGFLTLVADHVGRAVTYEYTNGLLTGVVDRGGGRWRYAYGGWDGNALVSVTDAAGHTSEVAYWPESSWLKSVRDPAQAPLVQLEFGDFDQPDSRRVRTASDPSGVELGFIDGWVVEAVDAGGFATTYERDRSGRVVAVTTPRGNEPDADPAQFTTIIGYDDMGRLVSLVDPTGRAATVDRDDRGKPVWIAGSGADAGSGVTVGYDAEGFVERVVQPGGGETLFAWDDGELASMLLPDGSEQGVVRDNRNLPGAYRTRLRHHTFLQRDDLGRVVMESSHTGGKTFYQYDDLDRVIATTDPVGRTVRYRYDEVGFLVEAVDPHAAQLGSWPAAYTSTFVRDPAGRLLERRRPNPAGGVLVTTYAYDQWGRLVEVTDSVGGSWRVAYDQRGHVAMLEDSSGAQRRFDYGPDGHLISVHDDRGASVTLARDATGRVTAVTRSWGGERTVDYDNAGNISRDDPSWGVTRTFEHDASGRLSAASTAGEGRSPISFTRSGRSQAMVLPDGSTIAAELDAAGNVVRASRGGDVEVSTDYDANGRVVATSTPDRVLIRRLDAAGRQVGMDALDNADLTRQQVRITRDVAGRPVQRDDDIGTARWEYDSLGRLTGEEQPWPGLVARDPLVSAFVYSAGADPTRITMPTGREVQYSYGPDRLVRRVVDQASGAGALPTVFELAHDRGELTEVAYGVVGGVQRWEPGPVRGMAAAITWHGANGDAYGIRYGYDDQGRVATRRHDQGAVEYTYDELGRYASEVLSGAGSAGTRRYEYDAIGRLTRLWRGEDSYTYHYNDDGNPTRVDTPEGAVEFSYDRAGSRSSQRSPEGVVIYGYDPHGRLAEVEWAQTGQSVAYAYDGDGHMVAKVVTDDAGTQREYYSYVDGRIQAVHDADGNTLESYTYTPDGRPLSINADDRAPSLFVHLDAAGDAIAFSDPLGKLVERVDYDLLGNPVLAQSVPGSRFRKGAGAGVTYDTDTGLYHLGAGQFFDPATGTMVNPDPHQLQTATCGETGTCDQPNSLFPTEQAAPFGEPSLESLLGPGVEDDWMLGAWDALLESIEPTIAGAESTTHTVGPTDGIPYIPIGPDQGTHYWPLTTMCGVVIRAADAAELADCLVEEVTRAGDYLSKGDGSLLDPPVQTWLPSSGSSSVTNRSSSSNWSTPHRHAHETSVWAKPWNVAEYRHNGRSTNRAWEHELMFDPDRDYERDFMPDPGSNQADCWCRGKTWDSNLPNAYLDTVNSGDAEPTRAVGSSYGFDIKAATSYYHWFDLEDGAVSTSRIRLNGQLGRQYSNCSARAWGGATCVGSMQFAVVAPRGDANPGAEVPGGQSWRANFLANPLFSSTSGWWRWPCDPVHPTSNCSDKAVYHSSGWDAGTGRFRLNRDAGTWGYGFSGITQFVSVSSLSPALKNVPEGATHAVEGYFRCARTDGGACKVVVDLGIRDEYSTGLWRQWWSTTFFVPDTAWAAHWLQFPPFDDSRAVISKAYFVNIFNGVYSTGSDAHPVDVDGAFVGYGSLADSSVCLVDGEPANCSTVRW